jgi:hypothetical protein
LQESPLGHVAKTVEIVDLWPDRHDGYDLTDRILERRRSRPGLSVAGTIGSLLRSVPHRHPNTKRARAAEPRRASR